MKKLRLLVFCDSHVTSKTPESRIDNYQEAIQNKIEELIEFSNHNSFDYIICGGDFFSSPLPTPNSVMIANNLSKVLRKSKAPIYVVPGNHDMYSYNSVTLDKSLLGMYIANDTVKVLDRENPLFISLNGKKIAIEGQEYHIGIDKFNKDDFQCFHKADYSILVAHAMVTSSAITSYYKKNNLNHIDVNDITTNANLVITAHEHNGYSPKKAGNSIFVNPASLARTDRTLKHEPKALIVEIDEELNQKIGVYKIKCAKPYDEVFDVEASIEKKDKEHILKEFKNELDNISVENGTSVEDILQNIYENENIDKAIMDKAYQYLEKSNEQDLSSKHIRKQYDLRISEVELTNFQSHEHTIVPINEGLNAIIGSSDSGKTAIIRGIIWCLYNSPKGDEFMRTGTKETIVKVSFNDGSYIERGRTVKSAGYYKICDPDGVLKEFEGFGNNLPIEIANEHQMPLVKVSKDKECKINISEQLDGPFLLSESPSVKAQAIGKITHTDKVDAAIKELSADLKGVQKETKVLSKQKDIKNEELEKYKDLDKDKEKIDKLQVLFDEYNSLESDVKYLKQSKDKYIRLNNDIESLENALSNSIDTDTIEQLLSTCKDDVNKYNELLKIENGLVQFENKISNYKENIKSIDDENISKLIDMAKQDAEMVISLSKFNEKYNFIRNNIHKCSQMYKASSNNINEVLNIIAILKRDLDVEIDKIGLCPVCNSKIEEDNKKFLKGM